MPVKRAWAEIDREQLKKNFREIQKLTSARILAMVKADAYGHGAPETAKIFLQNGADMLGVACMEEARELRENTIEAPILIVGYVPAEEVADAIALGATMTVSSYAEAARISEEALRQKKTVSIHIAVDTGMTRLGFLASDEDVMQDVEKLFTLPQIKVEGVFTHLAFADDPAEEKTRAQFSLFASFLEKLQRAGHTGLIRHACSSAGLFRFPEMHLDMVRPGICLYGNYPIDSLKNKANLQEAMTLKATIARVAKIRPGVSVSYGGIFTADHPMEVATVLIGYGDGICRTLSNQGAVVFCGRRVPIVGRICMDQMMIDVTGLGAKPGDVVTVRGKEGDAIVTTEECAGMLHTIPYEVYCNLGKRIPRKYV